MLGNEKIDKKLLKNKLKLLQGQFFIHKILKGRKITKKI